MTSRIFRRHRASDVGPRDSIPGESVFIMHKAPIFMFLMLPAVGLAQEMSGISISPMRVGISDPVQITVNFKREVDTQLLPWCGLKLSLGDGNSYEFSIERDQIPFTFSHNYGWKGDFTISVER